METLKLIRKQGFETEIGPDLRNVYGEHYQPQWVGQLGSVVSCQTLRKAMGLSEGKLPEGSVEGKRIAGTLVYVIGRAQAEALKPRSHRPHRMYAICNHCGDHIPTGKFGQHLKVHKEVE